MKCDHSNRPTGTNVMLTVSSSNRIWLNYHDAVIYDSDVAILQSPNSWLNDSCIHYQMMRYQHDIHKEDSHRLVFIDPSVISFFMHQCVDEEELLEFYHGQGIGGAAMPEGRNNELALQQAVFIPINDTNAAAGVMRGRSSAVGTHWSLLLVILLVERGEDEEKGLLQPIYLHFDPVKSSCNHLAVVAVATKFHRLLALAEKSERGFDRITWSTKDIDIGKMIVRNCRTPQQRNAHDCGIYTLAVADILASTINCQQSSGRNKHTNGMDEILTSLPKSHGSRTSTVVDHLARAFDETLLSSEMVTSKKSFAAAMRAEILNSILISVGTTDATKSEPPQSC